MRRLTVLTATSVLLGATLAGCGGDPGAKQSSDPPPSPSTSTSGTAATANPTAQPWAKKFTPSQLAAYTEALATLNHFDDEVTPFLQAGKASPEAKAMFQRYFPSPQWQKQYSILKTLQINNIHTEGRPTILWSRATKIPANDVVVLKQCVDYSTATTIQNGKPTTRTFGPRQLRSAELDRTRGWLIYVLDEPANQGQNRPC